MERKHIRIRFDDFWKGGLEPRKTIIYQILAKRYDVEIVEEGSDVDYLVYSVYQDNHLYYAPEVIKICYSGENLTPDFNLCDYALAFDWMDFGDRYMRLPYSYFHDDLIRITSLMEQKHLGLDDFIKFTHRDFCSFVVSNAWGDPIREQIFNKLSEYKKVDSGGKWKNNVGGPVPNKFEFGQKHKFSICFENSCQSGYTTEKLVDGFAAQTIPIYWGDPDVGKVFNKKSFICVQDYDSLDDVVDEVKRLDNDDEAYMKMLRQPALISEEWTYENVRKRLEPFLFNIFDQPLEDAKRHSRMMWQINYLEKRQKSFELYDLELRKYVIKKIKSRLFSK